jgi:hypothetical protein
VLLANYAQVNRNCDSGASVAFSNPHAVFKATCIPRFYQGEQTISGETNRSAWNNGYTGSFAWFPAMTSGGVGSANLLAGSGGLTLGIAGGLNGVAPLVGAGDITAAQGSLILSAVAALIGSGALTADLTAQANATAALVGAGDITAATGQLAQILEAVAALAGSGTLSSAVLGALAGMVADLTGGGAVSAALPFASAAASADLVVTGSGLSTANVGAAVWSALATANNDAGTMGEKVNNAASAGDPWGTAIPGAYVAGTAGYILGNLIAGLTAEQAEQLLSLAQVHGLVLGTPLIVTATSRTAGDVVQTIADAAGTVTVERT